MAGFFVVAAERRRGKSLADDDACFNPLMEISCSLRVIFFYIPLLMGGAYSAVSASCRKEELISLVHII